MDGIDLVDKAIGVVGKVALVAAEVALFAAVPWLNFPIIRQIVEWLLAKFEAFLALELQKSVNAVMILVMEEANAKAASAAAVALKAALDEHATVTDEQKDKARENFKEAYAKLIRFRIGDPTAMD